MMFVCYTAEHRGLEESCMVLEGIRDGKYGECESVIHPEVLALPYSIRQVLWITLLLVFVSYRSSTDPGFYRFNVVTRDGNRIWYCIIRVVIRFFGPITRRSIDRSNDHTLQLWPCCSDRPKKWGDRHIVMIGWSLVINRSSGPRSFPISHQQTSLDTEYMNNIHTTCTSTYYIYIHLSWTTLKQYQYNYYLNDMTCVSYPHKTNNIGVSCCTLFTYYMIKSEMMMFDTEIVSITNLTTQYTSSSSTKYVPLPNKKQTYDVRSVSP